MDSKVNSEISVNIYSTSSNMMFFPGGEAGAAGLNLLHRNDGRVLNLGGKTSVSLQPGVRLICTIHVGYLF